MCLRDGAAGGCVMGVEEYNWDKYRLELFTEPSYGNERTIGN